MFEISQEEQRFHSLLYATVGKLVRQRLEAQLGFDEEDLVEAVLRPRHGFRCEERGLSYYSWLSLLSDEDLLAFVSASTGRRLSTGTWVRVH